MGRLRDKNYFLSCPTSAPLPDPVPTSSSGSYRKASRCKERMLLWLDQRLAIALTLALTLGTHLQAPTFQPQHLSWSLCLAPMHLLLPLFFPFVIALASMIRVTHMLDCEAHMIVNHAARRWVTHP